MTSDNWLKEAERLEYRQLSHLCIFLPVHAKIPPVEGRYWEMIGRSRSIATAQSFRKHSNRFAPNPGHNPELEWEWIVR
jgi:hypothetical protein